MHACMYVPVCMMIKTHTYTISELILQASKAFFIFVLCSGSYTFYYVCMLCLFVMYVCIYFMYRESLISKNLFGIEVYIISYTQIHLRSLYCML